MLELQTLQAFCRGLSGIEGEAREAVCPADGALRANLARFRKPNGHSRTERRAGIKVEERLQKIIANSGVASRRRAEEMILQGRVTVNGQVVDRLGAKADPGQDHIKVDSKLIRFDADQLVHYLVYKPQGVLCSSSDPHGRPLVRDLVPGERRIYPAGRLDFDSEGAVILTNDGELAQALTRAGSVAKTYRVKVSGEPASSDLDILRKGMTLPDGTKLGRCRVHLLKRGRNCWFEVVLMQGKNRQIRRMFDAVGHRVMRLRRVAIGPLSLGQLRPGMSRKLTAEEVRALRSAAGL